MIALCLSTSTPITMFVILNSGRTILANLVQMLMSLYKHLEYSQ